MQVPGAFQIIMDRICSIYSTSAAVSVFAMSRCSLHDAAARSDMIPSCLQYSTVPRVAYGQTYPSSDLRYLRHHQIVVWIRRRKCVYGLIVLGTRIREDFINSRSRITSPREGPQPATFRAKRGQKRQSLRTYARKLPRCSNLKLVQTAGFTSNKTPGNFQIWTTWDLSGADPVFTIVPRVRLS